jgi:phosphoadenosine phosphosulfate reductase
VLKHAPKNEEIEELSKSLSDLDPAERLRLIQAKSSNPVFTTSLGMEDQYLTWLMASQGALPRIVTLQTGRLFAETDALIDLTRDRLQVDIEEVEPEAGGVERYIESHGINGFYDSFKARKLCCHIRKVEPLSRALDGADVWITGLRRDQSSNRTGIPIATWDTNYRLIKLNPLADVDIETILAEIALHDIPVNPMHQRGYPSIGCEPCTRAIKPGETDRAGRWWWEVGQTSECGLHVAVDQPAETTIANFSDGRSRNAPT